MTLRRATAALMLGSLVCIEVLCSCSSQPTPLTLPPFAPTLAEGESSPVEILESATRELRRRGWQPPRRGFAARVFPIKGEAGNRHEWLVYFDNPDDPWAIVTFILDPFGRVIATDGLRDER